MLYIKTFENHNLDNPYTEYCNSQDLDSIRKLIHDGVDPSINNNIVLIWASYFNHLDIVKLLLKDDRVDPSDRHNEALKKAIDKGHVEVAEALLNDERMDLSNLDKFESFNDVIYQLLDLAKYTSDEMLILLLKQPYIKNNISEKKLLYYMQPFLDELFIKMNK